jgi:hypothetical protein
MKAVYIPYNNLSPTNRAKLDYIRKNGQPFAVFGKVGVRLMLFKDLQTLELYNYNIEATKKEQQKQLDEALKNTEFFDQGGLQVPSGVTLGAKLTPGGKQAGKSSGLIWVGLLIVGLILFLFKK